MGVNVAGTWSESVSELIDVISVEDVTVATFGEFLAQHSVFMRLCGIVYSKKHTSAGQVVILEKLIVKGVKAMKALLRYSLQLSLPSRLSFAEAQRSLC